MVQHSSCTPRCWTWGSPSCAPTVPASTGKGAQVMEKEEGEHQGQGLPCPYSRVSTSVLTLAMGTPFPGHARGPPAPQLCLWAGDRLHAVLGAAAAPAPGTLGWHLHPASASLSQQCHLPERSASSGGRGAALGTSPGPRSPALPSGAAHALSGLAAGSRGAAGCSPVLAPIEQGPPHRDLLTAPTIVWRIKIIKQQVHFPGPCPALAARP